MYFPDGTNFKCYSSKSKLDQPVVQRNTVYSVTKRVKDIVLAILLLTILSPFIVLFSITIYLHDKSTPLFIQERIGLNGQKFKCLKLRTMVVDAQERLDRVLATNPVAASEWEKDQKLRNDPRITRVGMFLRKTSLDELPQLWNIIVGDMSFIGPRPIVEDEVKKYGQFFKYYTSVKPGITGLWQVNGRNNTSYRQRVVLDVTYAKRQSLVLDLGIIVKTIPVVLFSKGAF